MLKSAFLSLIRAGSGLRAHHLDFLLCGNPIKVKIKLSTPVCAAANFRVAALRKGSALVSVATLRVFGTQFAEMPFVATKEGASPDWITIADPLQLPSRHPQSPVWQSHTLEQNEVRGGGVLTTVEQSECLRALWNATRACLNGVEHPG